MKTDEQVNDVFESASDSSLKDECVKESVEFEVPKVVKVEILTPSKKVNQTRLTVRYVEMYRSKSPVPRGNQRN